MIKAFIVTLVIGAVIIPCISAIPAIHFSSAVAINSNVFSYLRAACYFLPMGTIRTLFALSFALWVFRMCIAVPKAIWEVLPFA